MVTFHKSTLIVLKHDHYLNITMRLRTTYVYHCVTCEYVRYAYTLGTWRLEYWELGTEYKPTSYVDTDCTFIRY